MATAVAISVSGLEPVLARIGGLAERAHDFSPALAIVADLLSKQTDQAFDTRGASLGAAWIPLAAATLQARARRWGYYGRVSPRGATTIPLDWSGRLRLGFQPGSPEHVRRITPTSLTWGTRVPYAAPQQRRRAMVDQRGGFERRKIVIEPLRLWLQGVPAGAIATVAAARTGLR